MRNHKMFWIKVLICLIALMIIDLVDFKKID